MQYIKGDFGGVIRFIPYDDIATRNKMLRNLEDFGGTLESTADGKVKVYSEVEKNEALGGKASANKVSDALVSSLLKKTTEVTKPVAPVVPDNTVVPTK